MVAGTEPAWAAGSGLGHSALWIVLGSRGDRDLGEREETRRTSPSSSITSAVVHNPIIFHPVRVSLLFLV